MRAPDTSPLRQTLKFPMPPPKSGRAASDKRPAKVPVASRVRRQRSTSIRGLVEFIKMAGTRCEHEAMRVGGRLDNEG